MKADSSALALALALAVAGTVQAQTITFDTPSDDRWHYPFNGSPGNRPAGSNFGAIGDVRFNNRDAEVFVAWDTSSQIDIALGTTAYNIQSITVTLTNEANAEWPVDSTVDEWFTFDLNGDKMQNADGFPRGDPSDTDGESDDVDPGRPVELYGLAFDSFFTAQTWTEFSFFVGSTVGVEGDPRDPFPFTFQAGTLDILHVEDNAAGLHNSGLPSPVFEFTPTPWAVGNPLSYTPAAQTIPFDVELPIDLSLHGGAVRRHFQQLLNDGRLFVAIASLHEADEQVVAPTFPSFFMKEAVGIIPGAKPPKLEIVLATPGVPGDIDGDGDVDAIDAGLFADVLLGTDTDPDHVQRSDLDGSGFPDGDDAQLFINELL
ncbi:MAG: dockerin type I domain-containing protein [Phycisphaerae bacterium]